jgi:hypothetical protein
MATCLGVRKFDVYNCTPGSVVCTHIVRPLDSSTTVAANVSASAPSCYYNAHSSASHYLVDNHEPTRNCDRNPYKHALTHACKHHNNVPIRWLQQIIINACAYNVHTTQHLRIQQEESSHTNLGRCGEVKRSAVDFENLASRNQLRIDRRVMFRVESQQMIGD